MCVCLCLLCLRVLPAVHAWHKHVCVIVPSVFPCAKRLLALYTTAPPALGTHSAERNTHTHTLTSIRIHTYSHTAGCSDVTELTPRD